MSFINVSILLPAPASVYFSVSIEVLLDFLKGELNESEILIYLLYVLHS